MDRGELLTRITVWISVAGYSLGVCFGAFANRRPQWRTQARLAWTAGCLGLFAHAICALHYHHHWSQAAAYRETARQTAELTGIAWGGGLIINYAFLAAWAVDVGWWWFGAEAHRRRHWLISAVWQGFMIFMIFNATVVFKTGLVRWVGVAICAGASLVWLTQIRNRKP
jgi:predicted membrane-bound dolichyl-phosphate-mannose-protein mannosyltransferase